MPSSIFCPPCSVLSPLSSVFCFCLLLYLPSAQAYPPLQLYIALTPAGGVLRPAPGVYSGPVVVDKPITIEGEGRVTLDGGGSGSVVRVTADGVVLRGLHLTHSGNSHDQVDAGISLEANGALIENNRIDQVLFGIQLQKAYDNLIRNNRISSFDVAPSLRGEGLRVWNSSDNRFENNQFEQVRDIYFTNAPDNLFSGNRISNSRVAMELVFSPGNRIENNSIQASGRGIVVVYSDELHILNNQISHLRDFAGAAISVKESSQVSIEGNHILHCALGLRANSPIHPENTLSLKGNHFAYNDIALYFYGEKGGHQIHDNRFEQNLLSVAVSAPTSALLHDWRGNQWDEYQGFDLDGDGFGDQPHDVYLHSDQLWLDRPMTRFFRGSPVLETLDFLERLSAYSEPELILRDPRPRLP